MTIRKNLRSRVGVIGGALIVVSAWCEIPAIGQRPVVNSGVTPRPVTPRGNLSADEKSTIDLFQKARASVVYINTRERVVYPWTRNMFSIPRGTGSGFVWDGRGHIVTRSEEHTSELQS